MKKKETIGECGQLRGGPWGEIKKWIHEVRPRAYLPPTSRSERIKHYHEVQGCCPRKICAKRGAVHGMRPFRSATTVVCGKYQFPTGKRPGVVSRQLARGARFGLTPKQFFPSSLARVCPAPCESAPLPAYWGSMSPWHQRIEMDHCRSRFQRRIGSSRAAADTDGKKWRSSAADRGPGRRRRRQQINARAPGYRLRTGRHRTGGR